MNKKSKLSDEELERLLAKQKPAAPFIPLKQSRAMQEALSRCREFMPMTMGRK
jgi:hypothetical protein